MSLRRRLTISVAVAVALSIAIACVIAYLAVRSELRGQLDQQLREQARIAAALPAPPGSGDPSVPFEIPADPDSEFGPPSGVRVLDPEGDVLVDRGGLPDLEEAEEGELVDVEIGGEGQRVLVAEGPAGGTLQIARSLEPVNETLTDLRAVLFIVIAAGVAAAALAARAIAGRVIGPVSELGETAQHVTETQDLSRRIEVEGDDEVAQLGARFNAMLARLEASRDELDEAHSEQRRLIADASHELRTPVTSLRTNIEVIAAGGLGHQEESRALAAASAQAEELGVLIGDLMDLARGEQAIVEMEETRLDEVVAECVERARRNAPRVDFLLECEPSVVQGSPERLARAVNNLLDNAAQHGGGGPVEVAVRNGMVTVRDHGPGVAAAEASRVFDRFYRGAEARRRPGSGLGLAIVRQVAEAHQGAVSVRDVEGGGALFELRIGTN